ncbi:hypothetical protein [Sneathiella aquimaris]|uniref:hypothetical protein n=1 Tax=Sneathiella aquimaris TaxID=2599305 RepID=UPI00146E172E|nr:hypothetical protein [Sneathiella aquimaris]
MNTLVIFELVLVLSSLVALFLMRRTYFPMNLFWAVGVVLIGAAAGLGALVYGGIAGFKSYHTELSAFAGSIGLASFALAALGGVFARQFHAAGWWIVLISVCVLIGILLFDKWALPKEGQYALVGILGLCALYRMFMRPGSGVFLVLGVAAFAGAGLASHWISSLAQMQSLNVYHILLSVGVLSFGAFAAKE